MQMRDIKTNKQTNQPGQSVKSTILFVIDGQGKFWEIFLDLWIQIGYLSYGKQTSIY